MLLPLFNTKQANVYIFHISQLFNIDLKKLSCFPISCQFAPISASTGRNLHFITLPHLRVNKDVRYLKNWRPISLLNADYKILAKVLAICTHKK